MSLPLILGALVTIIGLVLSKKTNFDRELQSPFECGFSTRSESRLPFSLRFFVLALIFVIFDVEIIVLLPFYLSFEEFSCVPSLMFFIAFLFVLSLGLFNEWNQNMLEWIK